jgi:hypothetical protein
MTKGPHRGPFFILCVWTETRISVRQNALAFWTPPAPRRGEDRPEAIRINPSGRAKKRTGPPCEGLFDFYLPERPLPEKADVGLI